MAELTETCSRDQEPFLQKLVCCEVVSRGSCVRSRTESGGQSTSRKANMRPIDIGALITPRGVPKKDHGLMVTAWIAKLPNQRASYKAVH